jgi:hypothetical protein
VPINNKTIKDVLYDNQWWCTEYDSKKFILGTVEIIKEGYPATKN